MKKLKSLWINRRTAARKIFKMIFNPNRILIVDLDALREYEGLRIAWTANIAMAIKDEFWRYQMDKVIKGLPNGFETLDMHLVANAGAEKFIDLLTHKHIKSL